MATFTSDITMRALTTETSGDLGYDSGEYRETLVRVSDGSAMHARGNYVMLLKRDRDGKWLIMEQVWAETAPAIEPRD